MGWLSIPFFAAGALDILLALYLLRLDFNDRANRAFALFLVLTGGFVITYELTTLDGAAGNYWWRVFPYFAFADVFPLLYFACIYPRPRSWLPRGGFLVFLAGALVVDVWYLVDHSAGYAPSRTGSGVLALADYWSNLLFPALGLAFAVEASREARPANRASLLLISLGFVLIIFTADVHTLVSFLVAGATGFSPRLDARWALGVAAVLAMATVYARMARRATERRERARLVFALGLLGVGALLGLLEGLFEPPVLGPIADAAWRLSLPALVGYALVRHQLFGIDLKVKRALHVGFVASVFVAVFITVEQIAESYLSVQLGSIVGGAAVGLLLFALHHLQRLADRIADAALPGVKPFALLDPAGRDRVYRDQARIAWEDGALDKRERQMLDGLRAALGMSAEEAGAIETQVAREA